MNHKYNPWLSLTALLLLALILVFTCTGCTDAEAAETKPAPRFTVENASNGCEIITDTETGVQYLYFYRSYNGYKGGSGLCKLEG